MKTDAASQVARVYNLKSDDSVIAGFAYDYHAVGCIRAAAKSFSKEHDKWRYPSPHNCHTFQKWLSGGRNMQWGRGLRRTYGLSLLTLGIGAMVVGSQHIGGNDPALPQFVREASVVVGSSNREYYAIRGRDAIGIWRFGAPEMMVPFVTKESDLCVTVTDGGLCLLADNGARRLVARDPLSQRTVLDINLDGKACALSAGKDVAAIGTWDASLVALSFRERRPLWTRRHGGFRVAVSISPDQRLVASGGSDGSLCLWGAERGRLVRKLHMHKSAINDVRFSSSGRLILTAGSDELACVVDVDKNAVVRRFRCQGVAYCVDFSLDERLACVGTGTISKFETRKNTGVVQVWELASGDVVYKQALHRIEAKSVVFTKDGRRVVSCGSDGVKVNDVQRGR